VHKQDTARLNAAAIAERIRTLGLKQYLLAEKLGVDTHTVNRWLTGKVKRISRDNLTRLARELGCAEDALSHADEADVRATQVQQTEAAQTLLQAPTIDLFFHADNHATYEKLLKAVMHPNMTTAELASIYLHLSAAAGNQGQHWRTKEYARLALEHAQRCGDSQIELRARDHLAMAEGQSGNLLESKRQLDLNTSFAQSVGSLQHERDARTTLVHVYRLLGDFKNALQTVDKCINGYYGKLDRTTRDYTLTQGARTLRDLGRFDEARALAGVAAKLLPASRRYLRQRALLAADLDSLQGEAVGAAERMRTLVPELRAAGYMIEDYVVTPASVFRRAGALDEAESWIDEARAFEWLGAYDPPFLDAEAARIAVARGDLRAARKLRLQANAGFTALGMGKWATEDPGVEVGQQFDPLPRVKVRLPE
jgi:transcriptional regulator with XRE-family HTH domain